VNKQDLEKNNTFLGFIEVEHISFRNAVFIMSLTIGTIDNILKSLLSKSDTAVVKSGPSHHLSVDNK
jgi:hypothetical protein